MHPRPSERQFFIFFPCHERRFTCVKVHLAKRLRSVELYILHPVVLVQFVPMRMYEKGSKFCTLTKLHTILESSRMIKNWSCFEYESTLLNQLILQRSTEILSLEQLPYTYFTHTCDFYIWTKSAILKPALCWEIPRKAHAMRPIGR